MNFEFSEEQLALRDEIRRYLQNESPLTASREILESTTDYSPSIWLGLVEMGVTNIMLPEHCGGFGLGAQELCLAGEEIGRQLSPVPVLGSLYLAQQALLQLPENAQRDALLMQLGEGICATLVAPLDGSESQLIFKNGVLTGEAPIVHDASSAEWFIVLAKDETHTPVLVHCKASKHVVTSRLDLIDNSRAAASVTFNNSPAELLHTGEDCRRIISTTRLKAACLMSFEQLGAADAALEMASSYARERVAFGRIIGSYQGIKHKLVDAYTLNQMARVHCYYAAWALTSSEAQLLEAAAAAMISTSKALDFIAKENIQTHGGMGYTWEMDCHLFFKRYRFYASSLGNMGQWHDMLGEKLMHIAANEEG